MKVREVELKFQVLDKIQLEKFLKNLKFLKRERITDIYLDTKDANLYKKGIFIRIRNENKLQIKFNPLDVSNKNKISKHEVCLEYSFDLPLLEEDIIKLNKVLTSLGLKQISSSLHELKEKNHLIDSIVLDKERKLFANGKFLIAIDEVKDLGAFIEIEAKINENEDVESVKNEMLKLIEDLKLKRITTGYNELWWRKHNFEIYLQGRYLLEEDYECEKNSKL